MSSVRVGPGRIKKELERLKKDPPYGVSCWPKDGRLDCLEAKLMGAKETPYEGGIFKLEIRIPDRYPFEPPQVQFVTQIYHPNIDTAGRICLDVLKSPPQGSWKPSQNISTILTSIQLLLSEPNPDDGLMADISQEYKSNRPTFLRKAKEWVNLYAKSDQVRMVRNDDSLSDTSERATTSAVNIKQVSQTDTTLEDDTKRKSLNELEGHGADVVLVEDQVVDLTQSVSPDPEVNETNTGRMGLSRKRKGSTLPMEGAKKFHSIL